ncbi:MAG: penicillin acylase family protein [Myxococcota bacterium]
MRSQLWVVLTVAGCQKAAPPPPPTERNHLDHVEIIRDEWGAPHIFGDTDPDVAFGLAYAHAEDDWPTIQAVLAASRGDLGLVLRKKTALLNDFYAGFVQIDAEVRRDYAALPGATRALLDGYAAGANHYAALHPDEADPRLLPIRGEDIAAGFVHKLPLLLGLTTVMGKVNAGALDGMPDAVPGSNAIAVHRDRSDDDTTRLLINSHQPWEGPVAWYEAHVHSGDGWDMSGGLFPGAPFILHGHNDDLGWAFTVNAPDLIDVYALETDTAHPGQYRLGDQWLDLEVEKIPLVLDLGLINLKVSRKMYRSVHGPALAVDGRLYAFRYASMGQGVHAVEQWYRMNRATTFDEWRSAMEMLAIPMFNVVYADRDNVFYAYNARIPVRAEGTDYTGVVPGDDPALIWETVLDFDQLPQVHNPPSGVVQGNNSTPFSATPGAGNPDPADYSPTAGVETHETNRARRVLAITGDGEPISAAAFSTMKWDEAYAPDTVVYTDLIAPLSDYTPEDDAEREALALLQAWDGVASIDSEGATIAILSWRRMTDDDEEPATNDPVTAFQEAVDLLEDTFGGVRLPLGDLQRLHRGETDLAVGGGPDVLHATYARVEDGRLVGYQGDSFIMIVAFGPDGVSSEGIHQYGASSRPSSPHYDDQAPLFVQQRLRPMRRDRDALMAAPHTRYRPGEELESL